MIKLTQKEISFLLSNLKLDKNEIDILETTLEIDDEFADKLRDLCTEKLDFCGYDENYELTKVGIDLNNIIDKLYI